MITLKELKDHAIVLTQTGVSKAKELGGIAKLNLEISSEEEIIRKAYIEIGKLYYAERGLAPEGGYSASCHKVTTALNQIAECKAKIADLRQSKGETETWEPTSTVPGEATVVEDVTAEPTAEDLAEEPTPEKATEAPVTEEPVQAPVQEEEPLAPADEA